jgi:hypothetical protein
MVNFKFFKEIADINSILFRADETFELRKNSERTGKYS